MTEDYSFLKSTRIPRRVQGFEDIVGFLYVTEHGLHHMQQVSSINLIMTLISSGVQ